MGETPAGRSRKRSEEAASKIAAKEAEDKAKLPMKKAEQLLKLREEIFSLAEKCVAACRAAIAQAEEDGEFRAEANAYQTEGLFRNLSYWHEKYPLIDLREKDKEFDEFFNIVVRLLEKDQYKTVVEPRTTKYEYDGMPCSETVKYFIIMW